MDIAVRKMREDEAATALIRSFIIIPMIGNWYPERYESTQKFKRDMAVNAISVWVFLLHYNNPQLICGIVRCFHSYG